MASMTHEIISDLVETVGAMLSTYEIYNHHLWLSAHPKAMMISNHFSLETSGVVENQCSLFS